MNALLLLSILLISILIESAHAKLFLKRKDVSIHPHKSSVFAIPRGGKAATSTATITSKQTSKSSSTAITHGLKNTLASGLAAACSKTILAPFDTLKTVQQHVQSDSSISILEASKIITSRPGGILNLYSGLGVAALGSMPSVGLYFGVYSYCKRMITPWMEKCFGSERVDGKEPFCSDAVIKNFSIMCSAAIGNTVASFSRVPYEVIKQSLQTGQYPSTMSAISNMWKDNGMRAFFPLGGISIQMVRDIPYAIFTLLSYEYIKENWVLKNRGPTDEEDKTRWLRDMVAGASAGGIGSYLTNPMDVIKTRLQTQKDASIYGGSISTCAMAVLEEGGPMAFLRGSVPRLLHKIPANGCFFVFYEFFQRVLGVEDEVVE